MGDMMATLTYTAIYQDFRVPPEGFEPPLTRFRESARGGVV